MVHTLYRHEAWKRFLHVLHAFRGREPSVRPMILWVGVNSPTLAKENAMQNVRVADRALCLPLKV